LKKELLERKKRIDFHSEGFTLFINGGGGTELSPIQIPNPQKVGPPKILGQPNQQDTNRLYHTTSVTMAPGFEEMPVTSFKDSNRLTCLLSTSHMIFKCIQKIRIYDPNPPQITDIKEKLRH